MALRLAASAAGSLLAKAQPRRQPPLWSSARPAAGPYRPGVADDAVGAEPHGQSALYAITLYTLTASQPAGRGQGGPPRPRRPGPGGSLASPRPAASRGGRELTSAALRARP